MLDPTFVIQVARYVSKKVYSVSDSIWTSTLAFPFYACCLSFSVLSIRVISSAALLRFKRRSGWASGREGSLPDTNSPSGLVAAHGGVLIFASKVLRLVGSTASFGLTVALLFKAGDRKANATGLLCLSFLYTSMLALYAVFSSMSSLTLSHVNLVLVVSWAVFLFRDIVPLLTYTETPIDHGSLVWALFGVLTFIGILVPLLTPRQYMPCDTSDPMPPNPVQTASPLSRILFSWLDYVVWKAYHAPHLPLSELPPLADDDHMKNLMRTAFPHLDPNWSPQGPGGTGRFRTKKPFGHWRMVLALLIVFKREIATYCFLIVVQNLIQFISPYVLQHLLIYLESRGEGAIVRPWVWAISLFLAPFAYALLMAASRRIDTTITVRMHSFFNQLILQHALRIRLVADATADSKTSSTDTSTPAPSENTSIADASASTALSGMDDETVTTEVGSESGTTTQESEGSTVVASPEAKEEKPASLTSKSLVGRMNNLISADLQALGRGTDVLQIIVSVPLGLAGSLWYLYKLLGWSTIAGFGIMLLLLPIPTFTAKLLQEASREVSKKSDDRVELVTETLSVIRMVKMFGWERKMHQSIDRKRKIELDWHFKNKVYSLYTIGFQFIVPCVTMATTYSIYALVMKRTLDAATVFASISLFDILRNRMGQTLFTVPALLKSKVSLDRITDFLTETELLDEYTPITEEIFTDEVLSGDPDDIGFGAASFTWSDESASGVLTPSRRQFRLRIDDELLFKKGTINLIVGPTGCGKTSLLMALLGEMHFVRSGPNSWYNLPRDGGIAYAAQESWVMNATIKENIVFESPLDEDRYSQVIQQCGLTRDLSLFDAGDETEVGEKGLTLSGGQKARVTLARAVYSSAEIMILDDILAALDVHTAKWIVDKCLTGPLVQGRTILLVTHNISMTAPIADFVVSLGSDGRILSQGTMSEALAKDWKLREEVKEEEEVEEKTAQDIGAPALDGEAERKEDKADGKLVVEEETAEGHISWQSVKMYIGALGGPIFWVLFVCSTIFECGIEVVQPWILGQWADQYLTHRPEDVNVLFYLGVYMICCVAMFVVFAIGQIILFKGALRASKILHQRLISTVLGTTLRWLDKTPTSRIITRCTQDVSSVDSAVPESFAMVFEYAMILSVRFIAVMFYTPKVGLFGILIAVFGGVLGNIYIKAQLSVKRELSKAKAPVIAHFGAAIEGLVSIRAYGAQQSILLKSGAKIDEYTRANRVFNDLSRWIGVRVNGLGGLFAAVLAMYFVYSDSGVNPSNTAFTLTMAVFFGNVILWFVQLLNQFEVNGNSLERLQQYMIIEQEPQPVEDKQPPAYWPSSGALKVENLSARYSPDGPEVLHNLSFEIKAGERVGIVGRTGSGKSSLTLSLLRCIFTEGEVYYDGLPISSINLDSLRSHITIIPQVPELLSSTLRRNLDPFDQFDDATLNAALRSAGLYSIQNEGDENMITLDTNMARGGSNLSVGQRQIIALARAMVRESKLLILDEATSAIDHKTDAVIQASLRTELKKDVTVITVAHRLQTIMDADKIMVLDVGKIVEFDRPSALLRKEDGFLKSLVDESGDRDALYAAAGL